MSDLSTMKEFGPNKRANRFEKETPPKSPTSNGSVRREGAVPNVEKHWKRKESSK